MCQKRRTYLLLHLPHLELVCAELGVIHLVLFLAPVLDKGLDLADEGATCGTDGLAGLL